MATCRTLPTAAPPGCGEARWYVRRVAESSAIDASARDAPTLRQLRDAQRDRRVLVAIAAEDAAVAGPAVRAAFDAAVRPDRVRVSVAVPADRAADQQLDRWADDPRVVIDGVPVGATSSEPDMAMLRSAARRRFDGEPFVVFTDAPVQFASKWDEYLVDALRAVDAARPLIDLAASLDANGVSGRGPKGPAPLRVVRRRLVEIAAPGRLCVDVPVDEWDHDGSRFAVRAYTHGYDVFAAPARIVDVSASGAASPDSAIRCDDDVGADDGGIPTAIDGLGTRRTVAAFSRLLAWSDASSAAHDFLDGGVGESATF